MEARALSRAAVRELDRRAIEEYGVPSLLLMENAGRAVADEAQRMLPERSDRPVLVLCGPGNNGADGLVIARTLFNRGVSTRALFVGPRRALQAGSADFQTNLRLWLGCARVVDVCETRAEIDALAPLLAAAPLVIDALFGTGLTRELGDPWSSVIHSLNACAVPVLAVDLPSGLDADTGAVLGAAVRADVTVTFVAPKLGFERGAGPERCGGVVLAEIGIPRPLLEGRAS